MADGAYTVIERCSNMIVLEYRIRLMSTSLPLLLLSLTKINIHFPGLSLLRLLVPLCLAVGLYVLYTRRTSSVTAVNMAALKSLVVPAKTAHSATVIFSHGLGDSGAGWSFLAEQLGSSFPYVKWIFPNAPMVPITINMGMKMPGWYDLM